jgi:hypothetical protein
VAGPASSDRFLTKPMAVALALYGLFAITFARFQVTGDALVYFNPMRRFFGEHPDFAFAYQFGSDIWNWPFFLVGKLLGAIFGLQPRPFHVSFEEISITVATQAAFVLTLYLGWRLLRELKLPAGPAVLFLTAFGSPLFYYVVFEPAMKHAVDTLWLTAAVYLLLRIYDNGTDRQAVLLGLLVAVSLNTRYVNAAFFFAAACCLIAFKRYRPLAVGGATALIAGPLIFALPALRGISYFVPSYFPRSAGVERFALGAHLQLANTRNPFNGFDPTTPFKMLFSEHRGLFLWTPLTALAVVGFVLLVYRERHGDRRPFLLTLWASALALLLAHSVWGSWDGGFSFSNRFLTGLFPVFLIGVAELRRRFGALVYSLLVPCVAWSLLIAFVHNVGYDGISEADGVGRTWSVARQTPTEVRRKVQDRATDRWGYLWALLHGNDPDHVNGP